MIQQQSHKMVKEVNEELDAIFSVFKDPNSTLDLLS